MRWMKPTRTKKLPKGADWHYELKYDGHRALLSSKNGNIYLYSKGGRLLHEKFPEIFATFEHYFPRNMTCELDGEIVLFENEGRADFYALQRRQRLRSRESIQEAVKERKACFLAFDALTLYEENLRTLPWKKRKEALTTLFQQYELPLSPTPFAEPRIQLLPSEDNVERILKKNNMYRGEGIVAKRTNAPHEYGRTENSLKWKTPFSLACLVTGFDPSNDYFDLSIFDDKGNVLPIGKCAHGFSQDEKVALVAVIKKNGNWDDKKQRYTIAPSIAVEVTYTTRKNSELREARFSRFLFDLPREECNVQRLQVTELRFPDTVSITNPDKPLWETPAVKKIDFLRYVRHIVPTVLPYLKYRPLTVIRYPHGMFGEAFFQKECPEYAPEFVQTAAVEDKRYILVQNTETLLWLANQLAIEWHIPFSRYNTDYVDEIVFDLDPPDATYFDLAIEGSLLLKELCDSFDLASYVKFSGNKGLQVYIPLPENTYTWSDTALVTETFGAFLTSRHPSLFTLERMKKKRGKKLYIDVPQHRKGKTIIAPYSLRGNATPLVACPLYWEEVNDTLDRTMFTMEHVMERLVYKGCPFASMRAVDNKKEMDALIEMIKEKKV